jgi:phosphate transport system substrate-binding protein
MSPRRRRNSNSAARCLAAASVSIFLMNPQAEAAGVKGSGATLPAPLYSKWAEAYKARTGVSVEYESIGSGGGIQYIKARSGDFGASDVALSTEELAASGLVQFPAVVAGVVPVVNLKGVTGGNLKLTGALLADIFLGKIKFWNHPALAALNRDLALPPEVIHVLHRGDESGTTFVFTLYLSRSSGDWHDRIGAGKLVRWPTGSAYAGSEAIASAVGQTPASISYIDYGRAMRRKFGLVQLQNKSGRFLLPSQAAFRTTAASVPWERAPGFAALLTDLPGAENWPMTTPSFILMPSRPDDPAGALEALRFFHWAFSEGAPLATELGYVPLATPVIETLEQSWLHEFKAADGTYLWKRELNAQD